MITIRETAVANGSLKVIRIANRSGAGVEILNLGATVQSLFVPDRDGRLCNVVLGYDTIEGYLDNRYYYGATIGRFANRISNSSFLLDGKRYRLQSNDSPNSNHGGVDGFHARFFDITEIAERENLISLQYLSPDGEAGYPGQVDLQVRYRWTEDNALEIRHVARAYDHPTPVNITNHSYFNLSGDHTSDAARATLSILGSSMLEATGDFIPTGRILDIRETAFDFTTPRRISDRIGHVCERTLKGYNDYYLTGGKPTTRAAELYDERSGIAMQLYTDYPGVLLYTGDYLPIPYSGVCLEAQLHVDAPNRPEFPTAILCPGTIYDHTATYRFTVR